MYWTLVGEALRLQTTGYWTGFFWAAVCRSSYGLTVPDAGMMELPSIPFCQRLAALFTCIILLARL